MTIALRRPIQVTVEAFDASVERLHTALFELVEGVIVMMTNPTEVRERDRRQHRRPFEASPWTRAAAAPIGAACACSAADDPHDTDKTTTGCRRALRRDRHELYVTPTSGGDRGTAPRRPSSFIDRGPKLRLLQVAADHPAHRPDLIRNRMRVEHYRRGEQGFELDVLKRRRRRSNSRLSSSASIWRACVERDAAGKAPRQKASWSHLAKHPSPFYSP